MIYTFQDCLLDVERRELRRQGDLVPVEPQVFDLLLYLLRSRTRVVSKDELIAVVWSGRIVSESTIGSRVNAARKAIGDTGQAQRLIRTAARKGYRFVGEVCEAQQTDDACVQQEQALTPNGPLSRPSEGIVGTALRQVTIVACDLLGPTAVAGLDPETLSAVTAACRGCLDEAVERYGGFIASNLVDGPLVLFGYPHAHEDDAERAVRAALAVKDAVADLRIEGLEERLQVRASIATGLAVARDHLSNGPGAEPVITGTTAHVAVRLLTHAAPGAVVIAADTRCLLGDLFEYRDLGLVSVRDSLVAIRLSQVLQENHAASRFDALRARQSQMIGRQDELDFLLHRWRRAKRGESQVVLIGGEPGIGKSRLCRALQDHLADEPHTSLPHYCSPYHQDSALYPIIRQHLQAANIGAQDDRDTKLSKLEAYLSRTHVKDPDDELALIAALLSIPVGDRFRLPSLAPHQLKDRTLRFLHNQIECSAARQPVLMIFEDLQWIDPTSLQLLSLLIEKARSIPLLLVATHRPEYTPPWPNYSCISNLSVSRLSHADGCTLLLRTPGGKNLPPESVDRILSHSDGIPLFIEELTKTFAEGLYEGMAPLGQVARSPGSTVPPTLIAALTARLDRLGPAREIAQIASAIGREFSYRLVATVSGYQETDLQAALGKLIAAGIVFQRGMPPDAIYVFKHALVQEAAYAGLVRHHRRQLHAAIARALEPDSAGVASSEPELLAHHFSEAALFSEAIEYWRKAGELALGRSAFQEAVRHLTRGIGVVRSLPTSPERDRKELGLHIALGPAMRALKGFAAQETLDVYSRARDLLQPSTTLVRQLVVHLGLWTVYWGRAEHVSAHQLAQECLKLTECHADPAAIARASRIMGMTLWTMGRPSVARVYLQRCLDLNDALEQKTEFLGHDDRAAALAYLARALWLLGYLDQALSIGAQSVARARTIRQPASLAFAMQWQANFGIYGPDTVRAAAHADELVDLCLEHGIASFEHLARFQKGALIAYHGDAREGIAVMRDALAALGSAGGRANRPMHLGHLASAEARLGRQDIAYDHLQQAIREADATEEKFFQAELYRMLGEVCLRLRAEDEGIAALKRALSIARNQQTRFWEVRAATTLADHWIGEGRLAKARDLLAPICSWFTEGFNMPDVMRAKALLHEIKHPRACCQAFSDQGVGKLALTVMSEIDAVDGSSTGT